LFNLSPQARGEIGIRVSEFRVKGYALASFQNLQQEFSPRNSQSELRSNRPRLSPADPRIRALLAAYPQRAKALALKFGINQTLTIKIDFIKTIF